MARAALRLRLHGEQHPLHIGVLDDGDGRVRARTFRRALLSLARIIQRLLKGSLRDAHALSANAEARFDHHGEHRTQAVVWCADQPAGRAAVVAIVQDRRRAAVDAELVLKLGAGHVVAARRASRRHSRSISG